MGKPANRKEPWVLELYYRWGKLFPWQHALPSDIEDAYQGPERHYHDLRHIFDCLRAAHQHSDDLQNDRAVTIALFFHDVVYDPKRGDNEERSADFAGEYLKSLQSDDCDDSLIANVRQLILDTKHASPPATSDGQYVVDIDLSILGKPVEAFDAYERAIRLEYAHVSDGDFRIGRAKVLRHFLSRPSIYCTNYFRTRYESQARRNLERSIARLESEPT